MLPVTHPKVLRSPNQIRNTLSAAHQICLCLHRSSLCGHAAAATCLFIQIDSGQNKRGRNLLYHHRYISLCIVTAAASPFMSLLLSTQVLLRFRGPQNISASSHQNRCSILLNNWGHWGLMICYNPSLRDHKFIWKDIMFPPYVRSNL